MFGCHSGDAFAAPGGPPLKGPGRGGPRPYRTKPRRGCRCTRARVQVSCGMLTPAPPSGLRGCRCTRAAVLRAGWRRQVGWGTIGRLLCLSWLVALAGCGAGGTGAGAAGASTGAGTASTGGAAAGTGSSATSAGAGGGRLLVVAAEDMWGSLAGQVGGGRVRVASIITNPASDPHDYEPRPADARLVAGARYVIVNGAGYDPWATKLLDANPVAGRAVLDVGALAGKKDGDNPHLWYDPAVVAQVVDRISADLGRLDPADAAYFAAQRAQVETVGLGAYHDAIAAIKGRFAGVPIGATESVFVYMAGALGLRLITPPGFMQAISDGNEPTVADKAAFDQQVAQKQIAVLVYNEQSATPDTQALRQRAQAAGIPVVAITETVNPAGASFQDWQVAQLRALQQALAGPLS